MPALWASWDVMLFSEGVAMKKIIRVAVLIAIILAHGPVVFATVPNECFAPPFVGVSPPPNFMLVFDNSGSMYDLAYNVENVACFDDSYNDSAAYYGYYDVNKSYRYDNANGRFVVLGAMPATCDNSVASRTFFCVVQSSQQYSFKGNFLNWLTMSKFDLIKKAFTGGKYCEEIDLPNQCEQAHALIGQSRGCVGRRFVKQVPGSGFSFGILGNEPLCGGADTIYAGGTTQIQIFRGELDNTACQKLMDDLNQSDKWILGVVKQDIKDCLNLDDSVAAQQHTQPAFNDSIHACWQLNADKSINHGDVNSMENHCPQIYESIGGANAWDTITAQNPAYICSGKYVGSCYRQNLTGSALDDCVLQAMTSYCNMFTIPEVMDPSTEFQQPSGTFQNVPAIVDLAISGQLGSPINSPPLKNIEAQSAAPSGVLQGIKSKARLGLAGMNPFGSGFEMSSTTGGQYAQYNCSRDQNGNLIVDNDGGSILSVIQDDNPDIIAKLNNMKAYAWTPMGETLYEVTRYFGGLPSAYNKNADGSYVTRTSPIQFYCQNNVVIVISDGESTYDQNLPGTPYTKNGAVSAVTSPAGFDFDIKTYASGGAYPHGGTDYAKGVAWWAHTVDINHDAALDNPNDDNYIKALKFYSIFALGNASGQGLLKDIAKYGGFIEIDDPHHQTEPIPTPNIWSEYSNGPDDPPWNFMSVENAWDLPDQVEYMFAQAMQQASGAGAVATVTQQIGIQDIVVRGAFSAYQFDDPQTLAWNGHLEAYWAYEGCSDYANISACTSVAGCKWETTSCTPVCTDRADPNSCVAATGCQWAGNKCSANSDLFGTCSAIVSSNYCTDQPGCVWRSSPRCNGLTYSFQKKQNQNLFCSDTLDHCWDAETELPDSFDRKIFTMVRGEQKFFESSNMCTEADWLALSVDPYFVDTDCSALVDWMRGEDTWVKAQDHRKGWILRDIVYSTPVSVQQPSLSSIPSSQALDSCDIPACVDGCSSSCPSDCSRNCFYCYRECQKHRKRMVYVGGNDGMLHAFVAGVWTDDGGGRWVSDPTDPNGSLVGQELWAFIPSNMLPRLKELARPSYGTAGGCKHQTMVDLSPQVWDVFIDPSGTGLQPREWRTVLLGGERGGGDLYFAIDVTDPDNPKVLWEFPVLRNRVHMAKIGGSYVVDQPYLSRGNYEQVRSLPASWSVPYAGKLNIPEGVNFLAADTVATWTPGAPVPNIRSYGGSDLSGWFAVIGGGPRIFDLNDLPSTLTDAQKRATLKPDLLMIDIEKGINIFQYTWPLLVAMKSSTWWPDQPSGDGTSFIPYSVGSPAVLDIWDSSGTNNSDGYMDHIYFGDLNGLFYSIKLNLDSAATTKGMKIDISRTKPIALATPTLAEPCTKDYFRSSFQPITVLPTIAFDPDYNLRVYFGAGKFDNIDGPCSDKNDAATMSFYALKDSDKKTAGMIAAAGSVSAQINTQPATFSGDDSADGFELRGFTVQIGSQCFSDSPFTTPCKWTNDNGSPDCCQSTCCWSNIRDLLFPGERVVDSSLVAGGLLVFTTFVPSTDKCTGGGSSYIYLLDYLGRPMPKDPLRDAGFTSVGSIASSSAGLSQSTLQTSQYATITQGVGGGATAYVAMLGSGMPSRPVLDSSGQYLFVQTSDAQIHRIKIDLPMLPVQLRGWWEQGVE